MTNEKDVLQPSLWTKRPVEETIAVYADWAATYEQDVTRRGYQTPARIAAALRQFASPDISILDFGCGTGLGAFALREAGFTNLQGTDITAQMLAKATASGLYAKTWLSEPGQLDFAQGDFGAIVAIGVISLGAAPAETLAPLAEKLAKGGLLALSFNDPTLDDEGYTRALDALVSKGTVRILFRAHGPHLDDVGMGSDVIVLERL